MIPVPRRRWLEPVLAAAVTTVLSYVVSRARPFRLGDEGYLFLVARELAAGAGFHARFEPIYPAGVFVWLGAWMDLFGAVVPVFRAAAAALVGLAGGGLWWLLRRRAGAAVAAAALTAIVALGTVPGAFKLVGMAIVAIALDRLLAARPLPATVATRSWLALPAGAGLLAGWREDSAALLAALALWAWWRGPRTAARGIAWIVAAATGTLPWVLYFLARGELAAAAEHLSSRFVFLFRRLADPTDVAWRPPSELPASFEQLGEALLPALVALPVLLYGFLLVRSRRRPRGEGAEADRLAALLGFAYLAQFAWERPDVTHFRFHAPVLVVAVALSAAAAAPRRRALFAAALLVPIVAVGAQRLLAGPATVAVPYPCCAGARAGIRLRAVPPWAGRLEREGGTAIVFGWMPGLYLLEGDGPGTRHLSTFERHLDAGDLRQLERDLLAPGNRWAFETAGPTPRALRALLERRYEPVSAFGDVRLWRRLAADSTPSALPALSPTKATSAP